MGFKLRKLLMPCSTYFVVKNNRRSCGHKWKYGKGRYPTLRCQTASLIHNKGLIMELWKGNRRGQRSSDQTVTTHHRARREPARRRWQWRCEAGAQVTQKDWVTDRKHGIACGIITGSKSRESVLSDRYFIAFLKSQPWIIETITIQRRGYWSLGWEAWYCLD